MQSASWKWEASGLDPEVVHDELTPEELPYETPPIDQAIDDGWVRIVESIAYADPVVSNTMDMVRRYIAAADGRSEHVLSGDDVRILLGIDHAAVEYAQL